MSKVHDSRQPGVAAGEGVCERLMRSGGIIHPRTFFRDAGQATVEFALILPVLLLITIAMLDFGKAFNYWIDETHLANAAARWAVVNQTPNALGGTCNVRASAIACQTQQQADTGELRSGGSSIGTVLGAPQPGVFVSFCLQPSTSGVVGDPITATAQAKYNWLSFLTGPLGIGGLTSKTITATATMRLEAQYAAGTSFYTPGTC